MTKFHTRAAPRTNAQAAQCGTAVNFSQGNGKIRFEINPDAARRAGFRISSQLLKLARIAGEDAP